LGIRYVVFHKNVREDKMGAPLPSLDVNTCIRAFRDMNAMPFYDDQYLVVFSLPSGRDACADRQPPCPHAE
jgi:hypothetical protein